MSRTAALHKSLVGRADSAEGFGNALRKRADSSSCAASEKKIVLDASDAFWALATRLRNLARDLLGHVHHAPKKKAAKAKKPAAKKAAKKKAGGK